MRDIVRVYFFQVMNSNGLVFAKGSTPMILTTETGIAPHFHLQYSKTILQLEVVLVITIFISIPILISGFWMAPMLLLCCLITLRFFTLESIICAFPLGSSIQLRMNPHTLIWSDGEQQITYPSSEIKYFITRWFILLKLGRGKSQVSKLLLADSFAD